MYHSFIPELFSYWPLKKSQPNPNSTATRNDDFKLAFSRMWKRQGLQKPWTKLGFLTRALLFEGGLSDQISFTPVVMELGVFWKASFSSFFSLRVLVVFTRAAVSPLWCFCFDLSMYDVMVVLYLIRNVMDWSKLYKQSFNSRNIKK